LGGLKIVHINTYNGNGGAGRACMRLSKALEAAGHQSKVLVLYQFGKAQQSQTFGTGLWGKFRAIFNILAERILARLLTKANKTPFSFQFFGRTLNQHPLLQEADVIHLHWINHGFLTPKQVGKLNLLDKPIVWTFHDSNAFTGGCHVRYGCENFHRQCGNCPQLKFSDTKDWSYNTWSRKKKAYSKLNLHIVAPSRWMRQSVKESSLLGLRPISVIPNSIEPDLFKAYQKNEAKQLLKISKDKFVILSGFMPSKNDKHKGTPYLLQALFELSQRSEINPEEIEVVIFGNKNNKDLPQFPFKTTFLGTISKDEHLAKCYAAADVFVVPSLEDNLPNTVMEALSCATPVVAFETGGIPDMVKHLQNGYLAQYKSAVDLADGIEWVLLHENRTELQRQARKMIIENFNPDKIAQAHLKLYEQMLKEMPDNENSITVKV